LESRIFLTRDFTSVKKVRGAMFRHKLQYITVVSVDTLSRDTVPLKGHSHEKLDEMMTWNVSVGLN
jgi:hypothetical protein